MSASTHRKRIGDFLVEKGMLRQESIEQILEYCSKNQVRFGEAALELGLITEEELSEALETPYHRDLLFQLEPQYFPLDTKDMIPMERMLEFGVLPLGKKKITKWFQACTRINIGTLTPENPTFEDWWLTRPEAERVACEIEFFQVLPSQFLSVLEEHYGMTEEQLKTELGSRRVNEVLREYIERADQVILEDDPAVKSGGSSTR